MTHPGSDHQRRAGERGTAPESVISRLCLLAALGVFFVAVLGGEWLVHQLEYMIEYGSRFGPIMSATPHRLYMAPLGAGLAIVATTLLATGSFCLYLRARKRQRLAAALPARLRSNLVSPPLSISLRLTAFTALALSTCQVAVYLAQENLESAGRGLGWPGLSVLFARQHATVVPLHLLIAACAAVVLSTVMQWLARSRRALRVAEALSCLAAPGSRPPLALIPAVERIPSLRLVAGIISLRSPPDAAFGR